MSSKYDSLDILSYTIQCDLDIFSCMTQLVTDGLFNKEFDKETNFDEENINLAMNKGKTLLSYAIMNSDLEFCKYLIKNGADVKQQIIHPHKFNEISVYPIELTVGLGLRSEILALLLKEGAIINSERTYNYLLRKSILEIDDPSYLDLFNRVIPYATELNLYNSHKQITLQHCIYSNLCEELFNIVKKVPTNCKLKKLSFKGDSLCNKSLIWISEFIKTVPSIESVDFTDCSLYDKDIKTFFELLGDKHNLTSINLSDNMLTIESNYTILEWFTKSKTIVDIDLVSNRVFSSNIISDYNKIRKNKVVSILLIERKKNENSLFYKEYLPLDMIKLIFKYSGICYNEYGRLEIVDLKKRKCEVL